MNLNLKTQEVTESESRTKRTKIQNILFNFNLQLYYHFIYYKDIPTDISLPTLYSYIIYYIIININLKNEINFNIIIINLVILV